MKVAICFATGYEEIEALSVVDVLRRGEVEITMVGVDGEEVTSSRGITVKMDEVIDNINFEEYDLLVLPGGLPGVDNLYKNKVLCEQVKCFAKQKHVAAICAAPSILGRLGLVEGRKMVCYPGVEKELQGAKITKERVCQDQNIITGIGAGASLEFAFKILEIIKGEEVSERIKKAMLIK